MREARLRRGLQRNGIGVNSEEPEAPYDGNDQDCDGENPVNVDGDGNEAAQGGGQNCDDDDNVVHPGQVENCLAGDTECDGEESEDVDIVGRDSLTSSETALPQLLGPSDLIVNILNFALDALVGSRSVRHEGSLWGISQRKGPW